MLALFCSRGWEIPIDSGGAAKWAAIWDFGRNEGSPARVGPGTRNQQRRRLLLAETAGSALARSSFPNRISWTRFPRNRDSAIS